MRSAYAYDKKKALEAKIEIGESLVGRCFQEKEVIYMTNIPEGYTFVSSGLGGHEPRALFLMPLLFEDEPFGVIEIASFRELASFEIDFLKTIGERVASSISVMEKTFKPSNYSNNTRFSLRNFKAGKKCFRRICRNFKKYRKMLHPKRGKLLES